MNLNKWLCVLINLMGTVTEAMETALAQIKNASGTQTLAVNPKVELWSRMHLKYSMFRAQKAVQHPFKIVSCSLE